MRKNRLYSLIMALMLAMVGIQAQDCNKLYIPDVRAGVGEKAAIPVYVVNTNRFITGVQFSIKVEDGVSVDINNATMSERLSNHKMKVASKGNNTYTVMIYSSDNTVLSGNDGIVVNLPVYIADTVMVGNQKTIELSKVVLSDNLGNNVLTELSTGVVKTVKYPQLTLTAASQELIEGQKVQFTITNEDIQSTPLELFINSDMSGRLKYPSTVIMDANCSSVTFEIEALDNGEVSDTLIASIRVSAAEHKEGEYLLLVIDDDMPEIELEFKPNIFSEGDGLSAVIGKIIRKTKTENRVTIVLSDDSNGRLYFSSKRITIPANVTEKEFTIGAIDNEIVEDERRYHVTAAVYIPTCSCSAKETSIGYVTKPIVVTDDDGPTLKINSTNTSVKEGTTITFTISHNVSTENDVTVTLSSDSDDAFEYNHIVTIPRGKNFVQVIVKAKENETIEGNRTVVFSAKTDGYNSGNCWIQLTDQTIPDVSITSFTVTPAELEVGQIATMNVVLKNTGNSELPSLTRLNFYLNNSTKELGHAYTADALAVGSEMVLTHELEMPSTPGNYTLRAVVNEDRAVKELTYSNNSLEGVSVTLLPAFTASAQTDKSVYKAGEKVIFSGKATGTKAANSDVEIYFINEGYRQTLTAKTDDDGNYSVEYILPKTLSGYFIVGACYPNEKIKTEMASFAVYGLRLSACSNNIEFELGDTYQGTMTITNAVNMKQTGLKVTQNDSAENCIFSFTIPEVVEASEQITLNFTITPSAVSTGKNWQKMPITITSNEGTSTDYNINYYINSKLALLSANVSSINTTMTKGAKRDYPITITNKGKGETGKITLALPEWIKTSTPQEMASLAQGDSAIIVLQLEPLENMQLNVPVEGKLAINCANGAGIPIQFSITPVSESEGKLIVDVVDEFTFETHEAPHVSNAKIEVKRPTTGELVAQGNSGQDGKFTVTLPEGHYAVTVNAENHEEYNNQIIVDAGKDNNHEAFISYDAVTYSWDVVETEIEDSYEIETIVKYDTRVPKPVILISLPNERPEDGSIIPIVVTNKGFINAEDVNVSLAISGNWNIEFLSEPYLAKLAANQSEVFYAKITSASTYSTRRKTPPTLNECLSLQTQLRAHYICGNKYDNTVTANDLRRWGECLEIASNYSYSRGSYGLGGGIGGGYGSGWWQIVPIPTRACSPGSNSNGGSNGNGDNGGNGGSGNDPSSDDNQNNPDVSPDENTPIPPEEPEETNCDEEPTLTFLVADMSGKYSRKGLAADGESKVKIVLDGANSHFPGKDCPEFTPIGWHLESDDGGSLVEGDSWKEVVYTAPSEFSDSWDASKEVKAVFTYSYNGQNYTCEKNFALIRVPVVFVHGLNSGPGNWNDMKKYLIGSNKYAEVQLSCVDYKKWHNDKFDDNYDRVKDHITSTIDYLIKHIGYEVSMVDVVGHSMGGLLTKKVIQTPGSKGIRKLITMNTPHGGSQLGNLLLDPDVQYVRDLPILDLNDIPIPVFQLIPSQYRNKGPRKALKAIYAKFGPSEGAFENGAVANLSVKSNAINSINFGNTSGVKCHAIVCDSHNELKMDLIGLPINATNLFGLNLFGFMFKALGYNKAEDAFNELYHENSDGIVPLNSQMGGLSSPNYYQFNGNSELSHTWSCKNPDVQGYVLNVLLASPESPVFSDGFGSTPTIEFNMPSLHSNINSLYRSESNYSRSAKVKKYEDSNKTDYELICEYDRDENILEVTINKNGLLNVEISAYIDDFPIFIENTNVARIPIPNKYVGKVEIICDATDAEGNYLSAGEIVDVDGRGDCNLTSIQFEEEEYIIYKDLSVSPQIICNWSDGTTSYASDVKFSSQNPNICIVSDDGVLSGHHIGTTVITARYDNLECEVPVTVYNYANIDDDTNESSNSVCSTITLSFKQEMVMTRQAFRGTLTVNNGDAVNEMKDVKLNLEVKDEERNVATSHEFQIYAESLDGFEGELDLTAGWKLEAKGTGVATILFIPTKYAAPTAPKKWSFGGTFSYTDPTTGLAVTKELYPVTLTVNPSPNLAMDYFMQRDVLGDDALTEDIVEPMVPAEFSLLINNKGYGDATNVKMVTNQPEIIDNEKGLLINFEILSSQLNGGERTLALGQSVATDFGTILAGKTSYAQWWFRSSLLGHFTEYDVKATHLTSYGNPDLSLLDTVAVHELIHTLTIPKAETMRGFLVNDEKDSKDLPDMLYMTDGTVKAVAQATATLTDDGNNIYTLTVEPTAAGWNYGNLVDPTNGHKVLSSVTRNSDGTSISIDNFWQTDRTLHDNKDPLYEYRMHFADEMAATGETYTLTFVDKPMTILDVDSIVGASEANGIATEPIEKINIYFNKDVAASTFTIEDVELTMAGNKLEVDKIGITQINERQFELDIKELTAQSGYYVLTIQTAGIKDTESFNGEYGRKQSWTQYNDGKIDVQKSYELAKGWNWISTNLENNENADVIAFLESIKDQTNRFVGQETELTNDPIYGLVGGLSAIKTTESYKLHVNESLSLNQTGIVIEPESSPVVLKKGWNWIGYLPAAPLSLENALEGHSPMQDDILKGQDVFSTFSDNMWMGTLTEMKPGEGYMYYSGQSSSFVYPKVYPSHIQLARNASGSSQFIPWEYDAHKYADNMTIIGKLYMNEIPVTEVNYLVGAFCKDECRGVGQMINGLIFMTVHGTLAERGTISFRAYNRETGDESDILETLSFTGQNMGKVKYPVALHSMGVTGISKSSSVYCIHPRPLRNMLYIDGDLSNLKEVCIYSLNGQKLVSTKGFATKGIDIGELTPGVYIITLLYKDGSTYHEKVLKINN